MLITNTKLTFTPGSVEKRAAKRRATKRIAIHHTVSGDVPAAEVHRWHQNRGWRGIGYHYLIRHSGAIERGRAEELRGIHASAANADSIAIALTGNFEQHLPTAAQLDALVWLIRDIRARYGDLVLIKHSDVGATACPGRLFPWTELQGRLERRTHVVVSGDTLWALARQYDTTVAQLRKWNSLTADTIRVGQMLLVST